MSQWAIATRPVNAPDLRATAAKLASVVGGEALLRAGNFAVAVVIARAYGPPMFGLYAVTLAYATLATTLADNGLQVAAIQQLSCARIQASAVATKLYWSKTMLLAGVVVLLACFAWSKHLRGLELWIGGLVTTRTLFQSYAQLNVSMLKGLDRMSLIAVVQAMHFVFLAAATGMAYFGGLGIVVLLALLAGSEAVEIVASSVVLRRAGIRLEQIHVKECWQMIRTAAPMGLTTMMANLGLRLDVVLLSWLAPAVIVAHFAAAQMFYVVLCVAGWLVGSVLLAEMGRIAAAPVVFQNFVQRWRRILLSATLPLTLIGMWLAPQLLRAVFGPSFDAGSRIVAVLIVATPFVLLNSLYLNRAIALDQRKAYVGSFAGALMLGIIADLVLGRTFAGLGIAVGAVLREVALCAGLTMAARARRVAA